MQYLGRLCGGGAVKGGDTPVGRATYDFDGFLRQPGQITCSGEIRMAAAALKGVFGRRDVHLLTDDGRDLSLRFSERRLPPKSDAAHVEVAGDLPVAADWRR